MNINSTGPGVADAISNLITLTGGVDATELALMYTQLAQIDNSKAQLKELVGELDNNSKLQRALRDRMDKLKQMKDIINQRGTGEGETRQMDERELAIRLFGSDADRELFNKNDAKGGAFVRREFLGKNMFKVAGWVERLHRDYPMTRDTLQISKDGKISTDPGTSITTTGGVNTVGGQSNRVVRVGTLNEYVSKLKGQSDELSNKAQQLNLFTQSTVNSVQRATTFVSGLLKSLHDTNMAPIRKIG